jgi:hypothetical protein
MRIILEDEEQRTEISIRYNCETASEVIDQFAGLMLAHGYQQGSIIYAMEEYLESRAIDYDSDDM